MPLTGLKLLEVFNIEHVIYTLSSSWTVVFSCGREAGTQQNSPLSVWCISTHFSFSSPGRSPVPYLSEVIYIVEQKTGVLLFQESKQVQLFIPMNLFSVRNKPIYLAVSIQSLLHVFCWSSWIHRTVDRRSGPQLSTRIFKMRRMCCENLTDSRWHGYSEFKPKTLDDSGDLTVTGDRWGWGVQVHRAQRL